MRWNPIQLTPEMSDRARHASARLNSLGSLFWFGKYTLKYSRLSPNFHAYICAELERDSLRLSLEVPRDHFKTTIASVTAPMWWSLPFTAQDEDLMRELGYGDEWIRWMHRAHNPNTRTLIASEVLDNACKIGTRIDGHYQSNALFRNLFPEVLPEQEMDTRKRRWNQKSMTQRRTEPHGEGTYDFIGVKGALQSRHYDRQVIDDPVGEKAINSDLVMADTVDWISKLSGALDSDPRDPGKLADQLFIGNRWSNRDVGSWLRKNVPSMRFMTHSAEGGCCELHPQGQPIFPEEFSMQKLAEMRAIWGGYNYAAQFLNNPIDPEAVRFKPAWLRHYSIDVWKEQAAVSVANSQQFHEYPTPAEVLARQEKEEMAGAVPQRLKMALQHETLSGEVEEDIRAGILDRVAILDPNHGQQSGRSRHAICVLGILNRPPKPRRIYLLESWAGATSFEEMIQQLIGTTAGKRGLAVKWRVGAVYLESEVAGQQGWKYYFREKIKSMGMEAQFAIRPLKTDRSANAKEKRILGMEPIYENGLFWVNRNTCGQFLQEYEQYPNGATNDILDVVGYCPQTWGMGSKEGTRNFVASELQRRQSMMQSVGVAGY
jgi:hypothetical protein